MATVTVYNLKGEKVEDLKLDDAVFGVEVKPEVVQFVADAQRANAHVPYAHTKLRGEIRGGGKKPWRQKGTGRARHGSTRSPIWRGGGITFGPRSIRNMAKKVNKRQKQAAIRMVLSDKAAAGGLIVVDSFEALTGKTKEVATLMTALKMERPSALIASGAKNESLQRAAQNLEKVNTVLANSVNVADMLKYRYLVVDKAGVETLTATFK